MSDARLPDAHDPAVRFCTTVDAAFCDDFEVDGLGVGWLPSVVIDGRLELSEAGAPSSPSHALRAITFPVDAGDGGFFEAAVLGQTVFRNGANTLDLECDVLIEKLTVPSLVSVLSFNFGSLDSNAPSVGVSFQSDTGAAESDDGGPNGHSNTAVFTTATYGTWFHVRLSVDMLAPSVDVYIDGVKRAQGVGTKSAADPVYFTVGALAEPSEAEDRLLIDNVVVTLR